MAVDAQVRKQRRLLRDKRGLAAARAAVQARAVSVSAPSKSTRRVARSGPVQSRKQAQQRALARAGRPKDHRPIGRKAALQLKMKAAAARLECQFKHGGLHAGLLPI